MSPRKFLLIRFSSIGDIVLTAPAVAALHARFPDARIDLLTKKAFADVWSGDPRVRVRSFDPDHQHFGLPGFFRFVGELRAEKYYFVIDLHDLPKTRSLTAALGRPVLRYHKAGFARRRYVANKRPPKMAHTARRYVNALSPLGIDPDAPLDPHIEVTDAALKRIGQMIGALQIADREIVGLAPGSQWATKQWGWKNFDEIVARLHNTGRWVALFGSKAEQMQCEELAMGRNVLNFAGMLSLQETMAALSFCRLLLTNDSGPMHMAGARGCDVVSIFGSTTPALGFSPLAPKARIVQVEELECRPCSPHGKAECPLGHFKCMNDISVDQVWEAIGDTLRAQAKSAADDDQASDEGLFHFSDD